MALPHARVQMNQCLGRRSLSGGAFLRRQGQLRGHPFRFHAFGQRESQELSFFSGGFGPGIPRQHRHGPAMDGPREDGVQRMRSAKPLRSKRRPSRPAENEIQQTLDRRGCQDRQSRRVFDHPHFYGRFSPELGSENDFFPDSSSFWPDKTPPTRTKSTIGPMRLWPCEPSPAPACLNCGQPSYSA